MVSRVLLGVLVPCRDFGGVMLFSPMDFVDSVLFRTRILLTLPASTLVELALSLMALSSSLISGLPTDSESAGMLSACLSSTVY